MIRERVLAGLARAKEHGINLGRRRLEDCDAAKVTAIEGFGGQERVRRIARENWRRHRSSYQERIGGVNLVCDQMLNAGAKISI